MRDAQGMFLEQAPKSQDEECTLYSMISCVPEVQSHRSYKTIYNSCIASEFSPMKMDTTLNALIVTFPIQHKVHQRHFLDMFNGTPPKIFTENEPVCSTLKLTFTQEKDKLFLHLECRAYIDIISYDLYHLLAGFVKAKKPSESDSNSLRVHIEKEKSPIESSQVNIYTLTTDDDIDYDGIDIKEINQKLNEYHSHCIKRFEELVAKTDLDAYGAAVRLGNILLSIQANYKKVPYSTYTKARTYIELIERHQAFNSDPQIYLSLINIRSILDFLKQRVLVAGHGTELDIDKVPELLVELSHYEGIQPNKHSWYGEGTILDLKPHLEEFLSILRHRNENLYN